MESVFFYNMQEENEGFAFFSRYYWHKSAYLFQGSSDIHCIGEDDPGIFGESHAVQTGQISRRCIASLTFHKSGISRKHTWLENGRVSNVQ